MRFASLIIAGILVGAVVAGCGSNNAEDSSTAAAPPAGGAAAAPGAAATPGTTGGVAAAGKPAGQMTKASVGLPPGGAESNVGTKGGGG